jgi:hypothetical protein
VAAVDWSAAAEAVAKGAMGVAIDSAGNDAGGGGAITADAMGAAPPAAEAGNVWDENRRLQSTLTDSQTLVFMENPP